MTDTIKLQAKVNAVNRCHAEAKRIFPLMRAFFADYVGKKIENVDGTLPKAIRKLMPDTELPCTNRLSVFRNSSKYTLSFAVKSCELIPPNGCVYHEIGVYIGNMENGVLTSLFDSFEVRDDYTVDEIIQKRAEQKAAKEALRAADAALLHFGEYDQ